MTQYLPSLTLLIALSLFIIEVIIANTCHLKNRFKNMEILIEGLIKDGNHKVIYRNCNTKTTYEKNNDRHHFTISKGLYFPSQSKQNHFQLKRGLPKSEK